MADIPEHLLKRAQQARSRLSGAGESTETGTAGASEGAAGAAEGADGGGVAAGAVGGGDATAAAGSAATTDKIPAHLLDRTTPVADRPQAEVAVPSAPAPPAMASGNTQRLLTVVKSGSIQDVKTLPSDKVHVWPHLLIVEFVAALAVTGFLLIFSIFVNAPLLELANFNETTNPSKALSLIHI